MSLIPRCTTRRSRYIRCCLLALAAVVVTTVGAVPAVAQVAPQLAYVGNEHSNTVSVIDTSTDAVIATITVGTIPFDVAITPDGTRAYVSNLLSHDVSVIDTDRGSPSFNTVIATIPVVSLAISVAIAPDGLRAYVANQGDASISVVDSDPASPGFHTVVATISVGTPLVEQPQDVAITPDGKRIYVTDKKSPNLQVVDIDPNSPGFHSVVDTVVFNDPITFNAEMVFTGDGKLGYLARRNRATVAVVDTDPSSPTYNMPVASIPAPGLVFGIALTSDGSRAYVAREGLPELLVIDTDSASPTFNTVVDLVDVGGATAKVAISSDGTRGYATVYDFAGGSTVSVVDTDPNSPSFHTMIGSVAVGLGPNGIALTPGSPAAPADRAQLLIEQVEQLVADGTLNDGQGNSLISKLEQAIRLLTDPNERNDIAAMNQVLAFANEVEGLVNGGVLTPAQGQPLIDEANAIADAILAGL